MASHNRNRFTVYDMMEAKGLFDSNPANVGSKSEDGSMLYKGPQAYPKMLYHPHGETKTLVPGVAELTPWGPRVHGQLDEIIWVLVNSEAEEKKLRLEGWHTHPAHAIAASGGKAPQISSDTRIADLEAQIAALLAEKAETEDLQKPIKPIKVA